MEKLFRVVYLVFLACLVLGCQNRSEKAWPSESTTYELRAIREMYTAWAKALEAKDVNGICSFFADDFVIPYGDGLRDKKWYREFLVERIAEGAGWKMDLPDRLEVSASCDLAYAVGYYEMTRNAEAKTERLCGLDVLKKQEDGSWKFVSFR